MKDKLRKDVNTNLSPPPQQLVPGSLLPLLRSCSSPFENTHWRKVKQMQPMRVCNHPPSKPMRVCIQQPSSSLPSCCSSPKHSISNLLKCHRHFFMKYIKQSKRLLLLNKDIFVISLREKAWIMRWYIFWKLWPRAILWSVLDKLMPRSTLSKIRRSLLGPNFWTRSLPSLRIFEALRVYSFMHIQKFFLPLSIKLDLTYNESVFTFSS